MNITAMAPNGASVITGQVFLTAKLASTLGKYSFGTIDRRATNLHHTAIKRVVVPGDQFSFWGMCT